MCSAQLAYLRPAVGKTHNHGVLGGQRQGDAVSAPTKYVFRFSEQGGTGLHIAYFTKLPPAQQKLVPRSM